MSHPGEAALSICAWPVANHAAIGNSNRPLQRAYHRNYRRFALRSRARPGHNATHGKLAGLMIFSHKLEFATRGLLALGRGILQRAGLHAHVQVPPGLRVSNRDGLEI
jgi:hypothetical protein